MNTDWLWMTAAELGRGLGDGAIDARDLTETYLTAISEHPETGRIFTHVTADRARAEAAAAQERAQKGVRRGPLDGIPLSWKDLFDTAGVPTESGSLLLKGRVPERDGAVVARAARAGMVCLGKTHQTELAFSGLGVNPKTQTPPNVYDAKLAPGGSSSGAATSVAFGLSVAGIGSDTGGSVRVPSAWNGLVGLKTTEKVVSLEGVVPLCPRFDTIGPLCRSVEDAGLILAALTDGKVADLAEIPARDLRVLVLGTEDIGPTEMEVTENFGNAVNMLEDAGVRLTYGGPDYLKDVLDLSSCVFTSEAWATWGDEIDANPGAMSDQVRTRFEIGRVWSASDFIKAWQRLNGYRARYAMDVAGYDLVILPTAPVAPPNVERLLEDGDYFREVNLQVLRNTRIANLLGLCAISLPVREMPGFGLMAMGAAGQDRKLLRQARVLERILS
ncbi:amidase [Amaricoccus tamworthensis]|uniref:amidase n=1 Tax=Amaricoccus tamworthensis TaxID=57002 RepID=UPI003C7AE411